MGLTISVRRNEHKEYKWRVVFDGERLFKIEKDANAFVKRLEGI